MFLPFFVLEIFKLSMARFLSDILLPFPNLNDLNSHVLYLPCLFSYFMLLYLRGNSDSKPGPPAFNQTWNNNMGIYVLFSWLSLHKVASIINPPPTNFSMLSRFWPLRGLSESIKTENLWWKSLLWIWNEVLKICEKWYLLM